MTNKTLTMGYFMVECTKCGSDNHFDDATYCNNCGSELSANIAVKVKNQNHLDENLNNEPIIDSSSEINEFQDETENSKNNSKNDDELLGNYSSEDVAETVELRDLANENEQENIDSDSIELESPTDFLMQIQDNQEKSNPKEDKLDLQDEINSISISTENQDQFNNSLQPDAIAGETIETQTSEENSSISSNDKQMLLESLQKNLSPVVPDQKSKEIPTNSEKIAEPITSNPITIDEPIAEETIIPEHPIAFLFRNKMTFPENIKPHPGESFEINGQKVLIKQGSIDKKSWLLGGIFVTILILTILIQSFNKPSSIKPVIFGVVSNSETNEHLAGIDISIPDLGFATVTDENGAFKIADLEDGFYNIKLEGELYEARFFPVSIEDGVSELLVSTLDPLLPMEESIQTNTELVTEPEKKVVKPKLGSLKIKTNLDDAKIVVNGKTLGSGNKTFRRMKIGELVLVLKRDGYKDFTQKIKITPGKMTTITAVMELKEEEKAVEFTAIEFFQQAEELFSAGKHTEAIGYYSLALARDNSMVEAYLKLADANAIIGKKLKARSNYRSAADLYSSWGMYAKAVSCYDRIISLSPGSIEAHQLRGWAKINTGDYDGGIKDMEKAMSFDKSDIYSRLQLGKALLLTKNYKKADKQLSKIRKKGDDHPQVYGYLALAKLGRGDNSDAKKYYAKFLKFANSAEVARMSTESGWQRLTALAGR